MTEPTDQEVAGMRRGAAVPYAAGRAAWWRVGLALFLADG